ncbi:MAG: hypothetical protein DMG39_29470 [Acidobacteria bacterium]|nr:MAG: hypothetical protein DMG39_29470 [Acidobacteriota bacterium]
MIRGRSSAERGKTLHWFTVVGKIHIEEQIFRQGRVGQVVRPFKESAEVECRGQARLKLSGAW